MTTTTMRRLAAVLVLAGVFAGCGGGGSGDDDGVASIDEGAAADSGDDDGGSAGGGPVDESEVQDAFLEYAQCMRDNGIDMPDPEFDGNGGVSMGFDASSGVDPESEEFKAADEECQPIIEEARPDIQLSPEEKAELQDRLVALAECMRARGHDMPDPEVADDGGVMISRGGPDSEQGGPPDEQFDQDMEECHEEAGIDGPGGGPRRNSNSESDDGGEA
jgi:hypothetical protein